MKFGMRRPESALLKNARRRSQAWVLAEKSTDKHILWAELKKIRAGFAAARKRNSSKAGEQALPDFVRRTLEQGRVLFQSALLGIEDAIRPEERLQQITIEDGELSPRVYVATKNYLDAVEMDFQEESCRAYLQEVEKAGIFEMGEIWLLSPMLQLHLLSEVSLLVQKPNEELPSDSGQRIEGLFGALIRVQKASWKDTFQSLSVTEAILCEDPVGAYAKMDFRNCGSYRDAVEELSRYSSKTEDEIAQVAISMAQAGLARFPAGSRLAQRHGHVGYYLVDKGRVYLEKEIGYRAPRYGICAGRSA